MGVVTTAAVVTAGALALPATIVAGTATATGAGTAAATTATATAAATSTAAGVATTVAQTVAAVASGPVGWFILGAESHSPVAAGATFDCWKPVVRDTSTEPSSGKPLKEIITDDRTKEIIVGESRNKFNLPELRLINIWGEQFDINYLVLPNNNQLVAHAVRVL